MLYTVTVVSQVVLSGCTDGKVYIIVATIYIVFTGSSSDIRVGIRTTPGNIADNRLMIVVHYSYGVVLWGTRVHPKCIGHYL
jgi:hypothetical protein